MAEKSMDRRDRALQLEGALAMVLLSDQTAMYDEDIRVLKNALEIARKLGR